MHVEASPRLADMLCPKQSHPSRSPPARGPSKEFVLLKHPYTNVTKVKLEVNIHQRDTTSRQAVSLWGKASYQICFKSRSWKIMFPSLQYFTGTMGWKRKGNRCVLVRHEKWSALRVQKKEQLLVSMGRVWWSWFYWGGFHCGRKCQHGCAEWRRKAERCHRLSKWDSSDTTVALWLCKCTTRASKAMPWVCSFCLSQSSHVEMYAF